MKKTVLKNGVRVITVPQKNTKVATVLVLVKTGSKNEEKRVSGISHFLEHMFFKGTKKRKTPIKIAEELDKIGGLYNAFTGEDYTGYYAKVKSSFFPLAVDWVSDIYLNSTLPKTEIEKEKGVIKEEINMYYDNPMAYCQLLLQNLLYGDQPAGWDIAGTKESVSSITREDLVSYWKTQYIAENTVVVVTGNIKTKEAVNLVEKFFAKVESAPVKEKQPVIEEQNEAKAKVFFKETDQTHLCLGVRAYNLFHKDRYILDVIETILGKMMSSRLFIKIREELGLAYYIRTEVEATTDSGFLVTRAGVDSKKVEKAINAILKEYKRISEYKVSLSELKKAKENIKGRTALSLESSDSQALFYGAQELLEDKIIEPSEIFKEIDRVTPDDILRVSKDIFKNKKINLAILGPISNREKLEKILKL